MAKVICDVCSTLVEYKTVSAKLAEQMNAGFVRYTCPECQNIDSMVKALSDCMLDNESLRDIPDEVFIDILRMRGYNGTLKKSNVVLI